MTRPQDDEQTELRTSADSGGGPETGLPVAVPQEEQAGSDYDRSGANAALPEGPSLPETLRRVREDYGEELETVAAALRIQQKYLAAIEDGNYDALPGAVYASGWVRSYADYLGLDGEAAAARFKAEFTAPRKQMHFYEPVNENRMPGAGVLLVAGILLALAYGAYYYLQGDQSDSQLAGGEKELPAATLLTENLPENVTNPEPEDVVDADPDAGLADEAAGAGEAVAVPADEAPMAATATEIPADVPLDNPDLEARATDAITESNDQAAEEATEADTAEVAEEDKRETQTYGAPTQVRVVMLAEADSWVQITNSSGRKLFARTLFAGDTYKVPDVEGLKLRTGNAGGLIIRVDGQRAPSLGPSGSVRSNILLNPDLLLAGDAYRPPRSRPEPEPEAPAAEAGADAPAATPASRGSTPAAEQ